MLGRGTIMVLLVAQCVSTVSVLLEITRYISSLLSERQLIWTNLCVSVCVCVHVCVCVCECVLHLCCKKVLVIMQPPLMTTCQVLIQQRAGTRGLRTHVHTERSIFSVSVLVTIAF